MVATLVRANVADVKAIALDQDINLCAHSLGNPDFYLMFREWTFWPETCLAIGNATMPFRFACVLCQIMQRACFVSLLPISDQP